MVRRVHVLVHHGTLMVRRVPITRVMGIVRVVRVVRVRVRVNAYGGTLCFSFFCV